MVFGSPVLVIFVLLIAIIMIPVTIGFMVWGFRAKDLSGFPLVIFGAGFFVVGNITAIRAMLWFFELPIHEQVRAQLPFEIITDSSCLFEAETTTEPPRVVFRGTVNIDEALELTEGRFGETNVLYTGMRFYIPAEPYDHRLLANSSTEFLANGTDRSIDIEVSRNFIRGAEVEEFDCQLTSLFGIET